MVTPSASPFPPVPPPPKLLDRLADALRPRGYVPTLRQAYVAWVRRYIPFHHLRHPQERGGADLAGFLDQVARLPDLPR